MSNSTTPPATPAATDHRYNARLAASIEPRWQAAWEEADVFRALNPGDPGFDPDRPRFYCLDMFPYPSGTGLHVGHPEGYTATDIISRYRRLCGANVLHPMGWDAYGLPAEQYAIQTGVHPAVTTSEAIDTFRRQLKRFGFSYDWSREFATIDPDYYRWTQWIWLRAYESWFDATQDRARPIGELVDEFAAGTRPVRYDPERPTGFSGPEYGDGDLGVWATLDTRAQRRVVDTYRLAYLSVQTVNWCPTLGTALANEEVIDGRSERGGHPVRRKPLRQWMFRITAYAERLQRDLDRLDWPDSTRTMQRAWIGRSEGAEIDFALPEAPAAAPSGLRVYTTRPDTVFGATYMVVAPEHPLVAAVLDDPGPGTDVPAIRTYVEQAGRRADVDRMAESREKTGVATGYDAVNPATGARIPVWIADYVLMGYGHGAIMAVPAHDERDFEFARAFALPIVPVIEPADDAASDDAAYTGSGRNVNSANAQVSLDGLETDAAKVAIIEWLEAHGIGRRRVNYKLRDWLFSRQRYWGEPFPIVYDKHGDHYPVDPARLPVRLPEMSDYHPIESDEPAPLLAKATAWIETTAGEAGVSAEVLPPDTPVRRETNTMPGWAGSCWYYLRFCDPHNAERFVGPEAERYWLQAPAGDANHPGGVDLYIGGAEHAVLHLLYARFWHQLLYDLGEVSTPEPIAKLFHQGMITSYAYQRADKSLVPVDGVDETDSGDFVEAASREPVTQVVAKMSKSLRNVINPDHVIDEYGADTFRLYEMYMGPLEASKPWNTRDIIGLFKFLQRTWRVFIDESTGERRERLVARAEAGDTDAIDRALHRTIADVTQAIENIRLNTAIAKLIEFTNLLMAADDPIPEDVAERFIVLLSPFAPHIAEELSSRLGGRDLVARAAWPDFDPALLAAGTIELPVQVMGKVRARIVVPADADPDTIEKLALDDERVHAQLEGRTVRKVIVVPGKIVNVVC